MASRTFAPSSAAAAFSIAHSASGPVIGAAEGIEVLRCVPCPPESLEDRFGEGRNLCGELGRDSIFDGHMRAVAAGRTEALAGQKSLGGHPVSVIGSRVGTIDVALLKAETDVAFSRSVARRIWASANAVRSLASRLSSRPRSIRYLTVCSPFSQRATTFASFPLDHERRADPLP